MSVDSINSSKAIERLQENPFTKEFFFESKKESSILRDLKEMNWGGVRCVSSCALIGVSTLISPVLGFMGLIANAVRYIYFKVRLFYLEHCTSDAGEKERLNILKFKIEASLSTNEMCNSAKMLVPLIGAIWAIKTERSDRDLVGGLVEEYNALLSSKQPVVKLTREEPVVKLTREERIVEEHVGKMSDDLKRMLRLDQLVKTQEEIQMEEVRKSLQESLNRAKARALGIDDSV